MLKEKWKELLRDIIIKSLFLFLISQNSFAFIKPDSIKVIKDKSVFNRILTINVNGTQYLSVGDLLDCFYFNKKITSTNHKIIYSIQDNSIIASPYTNFFKFNNSIYQTSNLTLFYKNNIFFAKNDFLKLLNILAKYFNFTFEFTDSLLNINIGKLTSGQLILKDIYIQKRLNGSIIYINTNNIIKEGKNFDYYFNEGYWLYIDFVKPEIEFDTSLVKQKLLDNSFIKQISFTEFDSSTQIAFNFTVTSENIKLKTDSSGNLLIIVRQTKNNKNSSILNSHGDIKNIIIDPGHGGKDPGAIGKFGTKEKDIVLDIALMLYDMLKENPSFNPILTRDKDVYIPLDKRRQIANSQKGDLFISLHCNSTRNNRSKASGIEIYFLSYAKNKEAKETAKLENSVILYDSKKLESEDPLKNIVFDMLHNSYLRESQIFADILLNEMDKSLPTIARKVDQAGFLVLKGLYMPGILVETGFLSNKKEEMLLKNPEYKKKIAISLYNGILEFVNKIENKT